MEVKQHIWLKDFDWQALLSKKLEAPFKPKANFDNFDKRPGLNEDIFKGDDQVKMKETMLKL